VENLLLLTVAKADILYVAECNKVTFFKVGIIKVFGVIIQT